jgi:predicted ATPase
VPSGKTAQIKLNKNQTTGSIQLIKLTKAITHKYKSIETDQQYIIDDKVTVLVGMNESGKTSLLESLAKTNYFEKDKKFEFNMTHDYPRKEKKKKEKSGEPAKAITCFYRIDDTLLQNIAEDIGPEIFTSNSFGIKYFYNQGATILDIETDFSKFVEYQTKKAGISSNAINDKLKKISTGSELDEIIGEYTDAKITTNLKLLNKYFLNKYEWGNALNEYVYRTYLKPNIPKFLYYDEYYALPSRISIEELVNNELVDEDMKTAKALFELAEIDTEELVSSEDFEDFKAELEATQASITEELFEFWSTNTNLDIQFDIDKKIATHGNNQTIVEHVLDIRVRNSRTKVSLPLKNRSKGFNWFFSFLVWFKKIQEDKSSNYIILLDEPGLNLHASAQGDLLNFIEYLSNEYQIVYTTHSPFMVDPRHLERVRTVLETDNGTIVSDSVQEKDPKTLFPLQAALGYDIAQNLYISKNNLLVEGVSDLIYLQVMSAILQNNNREGLNDNITIVPVGGLEKVATFVSLLRGSDLNLACLLDSSIDPSSKSRIDNLIHEKIIKQNRIIFFDQFIDGHNEADIEDLFSKDDYLKHFNAAFHEFENIKIGSLNEKIPRIVLQLNKHLSVQRYNHYRPANYLACSSAKVGDFSEITLNRFEAAFREINRLFEN